MALYKNNLLRQIRSRTAFVQYQWILGETFELAKKSFFWAFYIHLPQHLLMSGLTWVAFLFVLSVANMSQPILTYCLIARTCCPMLKYHDPSNKLWTLINNNIFNLRRYIKCSLLLVVTFFLSSIYRTFLHWDYFVMFAVKYFTINFVIIIFCGSLHLVLQPRYLSASRGNVPRVISLEKCAKSDVSRDVSRVISLERCAKSD